MGACLRVALDRLREPASRAHFARLWTFLRVGLGRGTFSRMSIWRGTSPWFLLTGLILGVVVGFWELVKTVFFKPR